MIVHTLKRFKGNLFDTCNIIPLLGFNIPKALKLTFLGAYYKNDLFEAKFGSVKFSFRWKDFFMVNEVLVHSEYQYVLNLIQNDHPLIIDLGANIGTFSIYLLKHFPHATIHAYEASAETFSVLADNRRKNPDMDWTVFHAAAWKEDGVISFETKEFSGSSHISQAGKETVPAVKLATILQKIPAKKRINLLKIDIEGAEGDVLLNQEDNLLSNVDNIIIELHPKICDVNAIIKILRSRFEYLYEMPDRKSSKPLLIATKQKLNLPVYLQ